MDIELWNGTAKAIIATEGAWVTNLSDDRGDILFPKRQLTTDEGEKKVRGGCHLCLPNFGPGGESGLPQHGFGRLMEWNIVTKSDQALTLTLERGANGYQALQTVVEYRLGESEFRMMATVQNNGDTTLALGPAFHPYFALQTSEDFVKISGNTTDLDDLSGTLFESGPKQELATARRHIVISSDSLPVWAMWTDRLGDYVCVEPTYGGYTFIAEDPLASVLLASGEAATFDCCIRW